MAKALETVTLSDFWALSAEYSTDQDLSGLCIRICEAGEVDAEDNQLRKRICKMLADASLVTIGQQGLDAEGIWENPDGDLTYWTNNIGYTEWYLLSDMREGTIDKLFAAASPEVQALIDRYGYQHA